MVERNRAVPIHVLYGDHDWLSEGYNPLYRCSETAANLQNNFGLSISVDVLPRAGHHLYIDNSIGFHDYISKIVNKQNRK